MVIPQQTIFSRLRRRFVPILASLAAVSAGITAPMVAQASTSGVVISALYTRGGSANATYTNKYVELFNAGNASVNLNGWTVRYAAASNTTTGWESSNRYVLGNVTLAPGQYYLIQGASNGANGVALPAPDAMTASINPGGTDGKIALFSGAAGCVGADPKSCSGFVDLLGYGSANAYEGTASAALTPANSQFIARKGNGCTDTDNNSNDFELLTFSGTVVPRNSATAVNVCGNVTPTVPTVSSTTPTDGAIGVARSSTLSVSFSTSVTVGSTAFSLQCGGSSINLSVTGTGSSYTLAPVSMLPAASSCTVTVAASQVSSEGATPQPMAVDYQFSFATVAPLTCGSAPQKIYQLQDNGALYGQFTTTDAVVEGIVTFVGQSSGQWDGFFIQDPVGDGDLNTSDAIYVYDPPSSPSGVSVQPGDYVRITGRVTEFAYNFSNLIPANVGSTTQTQIRGFTVQKCDNTTVPTITPLKISLPFTTLDEQERYEGMLVEIEQALTVTELYTLGRYGEISLSAGRLFQPTNFLAPGSAAQAQQAVNDRSRIVLDDGSMLQNRDTIAYPAPGLSASNTVRHGDQVTGLVGVFTQANSRFGAGTATNTNPFRYRLLPTQAVNFMHSNPRPITAPSVNGSLKAANMNVLNYFNTFVGCYQGGSYATGNCRGASDVAEFNRQRNKIIAALAKMDASVIGLNEIENDAVNDNGGSNGATTAIADLVDGLNAATQPGKFAYINTGRLGTDAIKVGLLYQPALLQPQGTYAVLDAVSPFNRNTRPALAQTFKEVASDKVFTAVINHFKSKGSCPLNGDAYYTNNGEANHDTGDGQSCWNADRKEAATQLVNWLNGDPTLSGNSDVLILGDLNSYAAEDPIRILEAAGYVNLLNAHAGPGNETYTYVFDGQSGYLDHVLASASLAAKVKGAAPYPINADEPSILDYVTDFKTVAQQTSLYGADEYRASDHDPVLIGLDLSAPVSAGSVFQLVGPTALPGNRFSVTVLRSGDLGVAAELVLELGGSAVEGVDFSFISASHGASRVGSSLHIPADTAAVTMIFEVLPSGNPETSLSIELVDAEGNDTIDPAQSQLNVIRLGAFVSAAGADAVPVPTISPTGLLMLALIVIFAAGLSGRRLRRLG